MMSYFKKIILLCLALLWGAPAFAATITVTAGSTDELTTNSSCSLREAIYNANNDSNTLYPDCTAGSGDDTVSIPAGTYCLSIQNTDAVSGSTSGTDEDSSLTGDLDINGNLTITGDGASTTIINAGCSSGALLDRVMEVGGSLTVSLSKITLTGGALSNNTSSTSPVYGGGIYANRSSILTLTNSTVSNNSVTNTSASASATAGGIYDYWATLTLSNVTISGNSVTNTASSSSTTGGGIYTYRSPLTTISNSTISGNSVTGSSNAYAGGLYAGYAGIHTLTNNTIFGNSVTTSSSTALGGGIYVYSIATVNLSNNTISGNSVTGPYGYGGGVYMRMSTSTVNMKSTILSGNSASGTTASAGAECYNSGTWNSYGYNFVATATTTDNCTLTYTTSGVSSSTDITSKTSTELLLDSLANNGGDTQTMALLAGSPAIDAGSCTDVSGASVTTGQRGETRTSPCDTGAYEVVCGDGDIAGSETCDDGNATDADGCSSACVSETLYYVDSDGDNYGNSASTTYATTQPSGYVTTSTDCDDTSALAYPGASDTCGDDIDQDCDGLDTECEAGSSEESGSSETGSSDASSGSDIGTGTNTGGTDIGNETVDGETAEIESGSSSGGSTDIGTTTSTGIGADTETVSTTPATGGNGCSLTPQQTNPNVWSFVLLFMPLFVTFKIRFAKWSRQFFVGLGKNFPLFLRKAF